MLKENGAELEKLNMKIFSNYSHFDQMFLFPVTTKLSITVVSMFSWNVLIFCDTNSSNSTYWQKSEG